MEGRRQRQIVKRGSSAVAEPEAPADVTPYSLRHTCATLALKAGLPVLVVAERFGHANPSMVLSVYGRMLEGQQREATEALRGGLFGAGRWVRRCPRAAGWIWHTTHTPGAVCGFQLIP